jgi:hypothetical protein
MVAEEVLIIISVLTKITRNNKVTAELDTSILSIFDLHPYPPP